MPRYEIAPTACGVVILVRDLGRQDAALFESLGDCFHGRCTCPVKEYQKAAATEIYQAGDSMWVRLRARSNLEFDHDQLRACIDYVLVKTAP